MFYNMFYLNLKKTHIKGLLGLALLSLSIMPLKSHADEINVYQVTHNGCKYEIDTQYFANLRDSTFRATLIEFSLPTGSEFNLPSSVKYTDKYGKVRWAEVELFNESVVRDCDALVTATVNLKNSISASPSGFWDCNNLFMSNPNLKSVTFTDGYIPVKASYKFIYDCPALTEFKSLDGVVKDGVLYLAKNESNALLCYPPAKPDTYFSLNDYNKVEEGAFKGVSYLKGFTLDDYTDKDFHIDNGSLYDKDMTTLLAAVNTPDGILTIPASVTEIGVFATAAAHLKEFKTAEGSIFTAKDGIIYDIENKLIAYPMDKEDKVFTIKEGRIGQYAFYFPENLTTLIDLTESRIKSYAKYLKPSTTLLVKDYHVEEARHYHANTHSFTSFITDEEVNTGTYKSTLELLEGWSAGSVEFDVPENNRYPYKEARITINGNKLEATGLWPNTTYNIILKVKDSGGNEIKIPKSFQTSRVILEFLESTQTTVTLRVDIGDTKAPISIDSKENVKSGELKITGLCPSKKYYFTPYTIVR